MVFKAKIVITVESQLYLTKNGTTNNSLTL